MSPKINDFFVRRNLLNTQKYLTRRCNRDIIFKKKTKLHFRDNRWYKIRCLDRYLISVSFVLDKKRYYSENNHFCRIAFSSSKSCYWDSRYYCSFVKMDVDDFNKLLEYRLVFYQISLIKYLISCKMDLYLGYYFNIFCINLQFEDESKVKDMSEHISRYLENYRMAIE